MSAEDVFSPSRFVEDGLLISGGKSCGKSTLARNLAASMPREWNIRVFDTTQVWNRSSIPYRWICKDSSQLPRFETGDVVYDMSRLKVLEMRLLVDDLLAREFAIHVREGGALTVFVFEEGHLYFNPYQFRKNSAAETLRLVTTGRNFGFSYMVITQRNQLLDTSIWEICGQWFIGRIPRPLPYFSPILGKRYAEGLKMLNKGEFLYVEDGKIMFTKSRVFAEETSKRVMNDG